MAKKRKKGMGYKKQILLIFLAITSLIFLSTSIVLLVGLLPSFVAYLTDQSRRKTKALCVLAMNLAGCSPFLFELWMAGGGFEKSFEIIMTPTAVIVMYAAAMMGYMLDWAMSGIVANVLHQKGQARQKAIQKKQEELIERWGPEVTNEMTLDEYGFAIAQPLAPRKDS